MGGLYTLTCLRPPRKVKPLLPPQVSSYGMRECVTCIKPAYSTWRATKWSQVWKLRPTSKAPKFAKRALPARSHRSPIPRASETRAAGLLDLIHTDVAGPLSVPSKGGALYFVTFIDDKSRWLTVFPIKSKSDCFSCFLKFVLELKLKQDERLKLYVQMGAENIYQTSLKDS